MSRGFRCFLAVFLQASAAGYSAVFTVGPFIPTVLAGMFCVLPGRMLGDAGSFWKEGGEFSQG